MFLSQESPATGAALFLFDVASTLALAALAPLMTSEMTSTVARDRILLLLPNAASESNFKAKVFFFLHVASEEASFVASLDSLEQEFPNRCLDPLVSCLQQALLMLQNNKMHGTAAWGCMLKFLRCSFIALIKDSVGADSFWSQQKHAVLHPCHPSCCTFVLEIITRTFAAWW